MSPLQLYYSPGACSLAVHIALEEIGQTYLTERIVIAEGGNRTSEYLAVNPRGRVPALRIRVGGKDEILTELTAIMLFLSRRYPDAHLIPEDTVGFMRAVEWMSWLASTVHQTGTRMMLRPERFVVEPAARSQVIERGMQMVEPAFTDIEERLDGKAYAVGDRFSAVDAYLLVFFRWGNRLKFPMRQAYPEFTRIMDAVRARPTVVRVVEDEGIEIE